MEITLSLPMLLFLMLMTGFAGFVDSAAGGGGLISLPAYLFAGLPVHYTYGTNKFSAACGTTFATAQFFQKGAMNIRVGLLAAVGSFVGSALGSHIVLLLSDQVLRTMMLIILPVAAVLILWRRDLPDENRDDGTLNAKKAVLALAIGLGIGLYDGIFGPGTGTFAIIAFRAARSEREYAPCLCVSSQIARAGCRRRFIFRPEENALRGRGASQRCVHWHG